jgi:dinuclear metal center YbgI/SA1388 family protein
MKESVSGQRIIQLFEEWVPKSLAMEGDKVGLQVGTLNKSMKKVMITLDVLENVVDEAIDNEVDLIISHHAFIYKPLGSINVDTEKGRIVEKLIKNQIAVYVAHTNLDLANGGVNDMLMNALGFNESEILVEMGNEELSKLVVFVPISHADKVRDALGNSGAGHIGNYSHCTFNSLGEGTFKPLEGTNPYIGTKGDLEKVEEVRIETIVSKSKLSNVLQGMKKAHPYEEVAYDLYPVNIKGRPYGLGRIGKLNKDMTLKEFAEYVKQSLDVPALRVVGDLDQKVKKIGIIGGDGNSFIHTAKRKGCDVLITGDIYYHTAHDALGLGLSMIDPGHHIEKVMKNGVQTFLKRKCEENNINVDIITSKTVTEPFSFI